MGARDIVFDQRKEIVDKVIEDLKNGEKPFWQKGWNSSKPVNPTTGNGYKGVNSAILYIRTEEKKYLDNRWVTFKQAESNGWKVKKGEKAVRLEYWKWEKTIKEKNDKGEEVERKEALDSPMVSYFGVFNGEQLENIPKNKLINENFKNNNQIENIVKNSEAPITFGLSEEALYSPREDKIYLPKKEYFEDEEKFYAVALHEIAHSTGHESRLGRFETGVVPTKENYAREELVAEFSSMFLQQELGIKVIDNEKHYDNHKAYLQHYIEILEKDPNELFRAIKQADLATERVIKMGREKEINREKQSVIDPKEYLEFLEKDNMHKISKVSKEEPANSFKNWKKNKDRDLEW